MNVFLSYASEYRDIADRIALGLRQEDHDVFFDKDSLPAGETYDDRIRKAVKKAGLLIFLVGPYSIDKGSYALTELKFARQARKKVLPVMVEPTPYSDIPNYLSSVTVMEPSGNLVAEVLNRVATLQQKTKRKWLAAAAVAALSVLMAVWFVFLKPGPRAEITIKGKVIDLTSETPVPGVKVQILRRDRVLGETSTGLNGAFSVLVKTSPGMTQANNLGLSVSHDDFADASENVVVQNGELNQENYAIKLFPKKLVDCRSSVSSRDRPGVVIGRFQPINLSSSTNLSNSIAIALTYDLRLNVLTQLQEIHVPEDFQPDFIECQEARPRSITTGGLMSRALGADAFISGDVSRDEGIYTIRTYISDSYDLFDPPLRTENKDVNLDDPGAAHLAPGTHANIMLAIASGYGNAGRYADCIDATVAAERVLGESNPVIEAVRSECQQRSPVRGLLLGDAL